MESNGVAALILVVQDNGTSRRQMRTALERAGYEVVEAASPAAALAAVAHRQPDLVIQDFVFPATDGVELAHNLRACFGDRAVPILCVCGFMSRSDEARARQSGFTHVLVKPVDPVELADIVALYLAPNPATSTGHNERERLLVVNDDPLQRRLTQTALVLAGYAVSTASDGILGLAVARRERPVAIVSDAHMPKMDGFALCLAVRRDPELVTTPVVLSTWARIEPEDRAFATRVGASALLSRIDGMDAVVRAVKLALVHAPAAPDADLMELPDSDHTQRALWQLERQVHENTRLHQRAALREAEHEVLGAVAEALARNRPVDGVLGDVLAACLDMAGITKGALFLIEADHLRFKQQIGFTEAELPRLGAAFDCEALFIETALAGSVVLVPSADIPPARAAVLLDDAGVSALLLVPVSWSSVPFGLMVLGARTADMAGDDALEFARALGTQMGLALGLAQSFTRLAASEQRYRNLTENANDAISILSYDGTICEVNHRLCEILGFPSAALVGKHIRDFAVPGQFAAIADSYSQSVAASDHHRAPIQVRKADGKVALVEFSLTPVMIGGEKLVLAIGRDVTEHVRAQAQLMTSDRMASVGTLAAGVAHEINNPLAAVLAFLDVAAENAAKLDPAGGAAVLAELQSSLGDARAAAERVRLIVKDLKIFSRADEARRTAVDVRQVLESTLRMAGNEIRHRARVVTAYGECAPVAASESRLGQVFLNLIMNAAQAIAEGRADVHEIRITTAMEGSRVIIDVADNGSGMPPEVLANLFVPFFTTKPAGVGTGLGLTICHRIVTDLGGEITVKSVRGSGTAFRIALPASDLPLAAPPEKLAESVPARRGRVLVIDDDQMLARAVQRALTSSHDVEVQPSAQAALDGLVSGRRYDVILCDLMMPVVTGMAFYDRLHAALPSEAERIIFLTGGAFTAAAVAFLERVPNARLAKPFDLRNLRALINERIQ